MAKKERARRPGPSMKPKNILSYFAIALMWATTALASSSLNFWGGIGMAKFLYFFASPARPLVITVVTSASAALASQALALKAGPIALPWPSAPWQATHFDL